MKRGAIIMGVALLAMGPAWPEEVTFQAKRARNWDENAREGQCTIRVRVDDEADVVLKGDQVTLRTVTGRAGRDEGTECTQPLPRGVQNFEFRGIDGRGEVRLVQEPRPANDFTAVVAVRDPRRGDEGYTFRLSWKSAGGSAAPGTTSSSGSGGTGTRWWERGLTGSYSATQIGRGGWDLDGQYTRIDRAVVSGTGRDFRLTLRPESGRELELRGEVTREAGNLLEVSLNTSSQGTCRIRGRILRGGRDIVNTIQLEGDLGGRAFNLAFAR